MSNKSINNLLLTIRTILILLLIYTIYKSEFYWEGTLRSYYFKYYLIIITLLIITILTNFFSTTIKKNILTIFLSIIFSCYLVEGIFYFINFENYLNLEKKLYVSEIKKSKKEYDWRTTYEFFNDTKKNNKDVVVTIKPSHYINNSSNLFPLTGISNRETVYCNENGYWVKFKSDKFGLRNRSSDWDTENFLFLIGDSFGMGACVNDTDTIKFNLENSFGKGTVIDLSYNGRGPLQQYAILREYLEYIKPKHVVWLYYEENDLLNLSNEIKDEFLIQYINDKNFSQNIFLRQKEVDELNLKTLEKELSFRKNLHYEKIYKFLKLVNLRTITVEILFKNDKKIEEINYSDYLVNFEEIILEAKIISKKNNSEFTFVYLPSSYEYLPNNIKERAFNLLKDYSEIINILKENNIDYYDFKKELNENHDDPLSLYAFRSHKHFNPEGYRLLSKKIIDFINSK